MKIMSIDLGLARTGIAISDLTGAFAHPFCVIKERKTNILIEKIIDIILKKNIEEVVIGLPKNMDGSLGESAQRAISFSKDLGKQTDVSIIMQDERNTTVLAHNYLNIADVRGKKRKEIVDSVAATIILQDYLDFRRNKS